jgi:hypothetical protein
VSVADPRIGSLVGDSGTESLAWVESRYGAWRSLVARGVWGAEAGGSNPPAPTNLRRKAFP